MKNKKIVTKSTTFPISFICYAYNEDELLSAFNNIQKDMPNIEYLYIFHYGENGDKNHYHCLMRSNSTKGFQNVSNLLRYFYHECTEDIFTKDNNGNDVLKYKQGESVCYIAMHQFIQTNSLGDWLNYVLHNKEYLSKK